MAPRMTADTSMPALTSQEAEHSHRVGKLIGERIQEAGGWLSFERFMELALYAPGLGYYSAGSRKFGPSGDFVTAPEVSDLFSRCVAEQCLEVLEAGGEILELGAGTGRMAATVLTALSARGVLPERYAILEVSADLAQRQRERISRLTPELRDRVVWLDRLPDRPLRGVILANEVLDALSCRRFVVEGESVCELGVALEGESIVERRHGADEALATACGSLRSELPQALPQGYVSEICLRVAPWLAGVSESLEQGLMLLFDYGLPRSHYYHPQRSTGTLRCHFKQRVHDDPYVNPGVQDITAWVDFTRVAEAALSCGLEVAGFATQAAFLLGTGIEGFTGEEADPVRHARLAGEARRLLLPGEMGEAFKAMALTRECDARLSGFTLQDLRGSL